MGKTPSASANADVLRGLMEGLGLEEGARRVKDALKSQGASRVDLDKIYRTGSSVGTRFAGQPNTISRVTEMLGQNKGALRGLALLSAGLGAAGEFGDDEGAGRNTAQAIGKGGADLATTLALAKLGSVIPGIGTVGLPLIAGLTGTTGRISDMGADAAEGIYNLITGKNADQEKAEKTLRGRLNAARLENAMANEAEIQRIAGTGDALMALAAKEAQIQNAQNVANMKLQQQYNYSNMLNQSLINQQQNRANANSELAQLLLG